MADSDNSMSPVHEGHQLGSAPRSTISKRDIPGIVLSLTLFAITAVASFAWGWGTGVEVGVKQGIPAGVSIAESVLGGSPEWQKMKQSVLEQLESPDAVSDGGIGKIASIVTIVSGVLLVGCVFWTAKKRARIGVSFST